MPGPAPPRAVLGVGGGEQQVRRERDERWQRGGMSAGDRRGQRERGG